MNLQPLYDVKERLEYAAIAGVSLLGEDFRLQRAAEALKPLGAASPVFGKIDAGLTRLLAAPAEQRAGLLLNVLALVDAVAYTQAKTGAEGDLEPLSVGGGAYRQISYGQIDPLLTALTTTGGGRMEVIKSAWENHPEFFEDYRVLPAVIGGLGDSYGEMSELCAKILKKLGPEVVPLLKKDFDPAGLKAMSYRVKVIAELEGKDATPWLREILPAAKKGVRTTVIHVLADDPDNMPLLLDLAKSERGKSREAVLTALAKQDGDKAAAFWEAELDNNTQAIACLRQTRADWASDLVARGLWDRLEQALDGGPVVLREAQTDLLAWLDAAMGKSSPSMLDFWRWADAKLEDIKKLTHHTGKPIGLDELLTSQLLNSVCYAGPGPLCGLCLELWETHKSTDRYLTHAVIAALYTRSAAEVYDQFSPYVLTIKPLIDGRQKKAMSYAVLKGLMRVTHGKKEGWRIDNVWPIAQSIDSRWTMRVMHSVWKTFEGERGLSPFGYGERLGTVDALLFMRLADQSDPAVRQELIPYLRRRMAETGSFQNYSRWLLQLGASPQGVLKESMQKLQKSGATAFFYLDYIWGLLNEAYKVLGPEETAVLCQEVLDSGCIQDRVYLGQVKKVLPWTIEQLKAGRPFPEWRDWQKMR